MIPSCCFPTKVLIVDDHFPYLRQLHANLPGDATSYLLYQNPHKALTFLQEEYRPDPFTRRCLTSEDSFRYEHRALDVNIKDLYREIYNPARFDQISVIVVDYDMPGMNGLEFCKQVTDPNIQKILLTGIADEQIAVQAFNEGVIHKFIKKEDRVRGELLHEAILDAQKRYFLKLSRIINEAVQGQSRLKSALADSSFLPVFQEIVAQNNIVEHYQFESSGSLLTLDASGKLGAIFIHSEDRMAHDYEEVMSEPDSTVANRVKESLKNKTHMLCYLSEEGTPWPALEQWEDYLCPARKIEGESSTYYCAYQPNGIEINTLDMLSFGIYQQQGVAAEVVS